MAMNKPTQCQDKDCEYCATKECKTPLLDRFFSELNSISASYQHWSGQVPKNLIISPVILQKLSKETGFFQRPELRSEVTAYAPVISRMILHCGVVQLIEDFDENYLHFE
jgi:hypothetical protein